MSLAVCTGAAAAPLNVSNPSFENPGLGDGGVSGSIGSWIQSGPSGVFNPVRGVHFSDVTATDGQQAAFTNGGSIQQILPDVLTAFTDYTLSVDVGDRLDVAPQPYVVGLYAGGQLLAEVADGPVPDDGYVTVVVNYTAELGDPLLGGQLQIVLVNNGGPQVLFDNVRLDATPTPEPAAWVVFGPWLLRRRRRSAE